MATVFISYAHEDQAVVRELVRYIERSNHTVWWDRDISVGAAYEERIEQALDDCDAIVVVWSHTSIESPWVRSEAQEGLSRNILVPVCIESVRPPMAFRSLETAQLAGWPEVANTVEQQKLVMGITKAATHGGGQVDTGTVVVRDDPSLSARVAARISKDLQQPDSHVDLLVERAISDLLSRALGRTGTAEDALTRFVSEVARATNARHAVIEYAGATQTVVGPADASQTMITAVKRHADGAFVAQKLEQSEALPAALGLDWLAYVSAHNFVIAVGGMGSCPLQTVVLGRLAVVAGLGQSLAF